jgi:hypothetical protein
MTSRRSRGARLRGGALVMALCLLLAGCYTQTAQQHQAQSPDTRPYYCNAVGEGTPPGGHGNGNHVHPIYEGMTKGPLSWEDCLHLSNQLDELLTAVDGLRTRDAGEAAGWRQIAQYIPGLGTHHARNFDFLTGDPTFELANPTFLIYGGTAPDAPLVGVAYSWRGERPPEAFAGTNDWWHLHRKVCFGNGGILAGGEEIPDEECTALGGRQITLPDGGNWLLHVWIVPDYQLQFDIFVSGHPCLGETAPLPWDDPCWEDMARHYPADGPLPGSEHDEHGEHGEH